MLCTNSARKCDRVAGDAIESGVAVFVAYDKPA
jgi:hypothetical protein